MAGILKVGLTGGIACGRSTIRGFLQRPGWLFLDADRIVHTLLARGGGAAGMVLDAFGPGVAEESGGVDRKALARIVFADREARRRLESIVHPLVYEVMDTDIEAFRTREGSGIVVVDAALMVETGSWRRYQRLVVAHCPVEVQLRRLMHRDGLSPGDARARVAAQAPLRDKIALADYTVDTGGTLEETRRRALEVADRLEQDMESLPDLPVVRKGGPR